MPVYPWTLEQLVERVWRSLGTAQSDAEKQLYHDELAFLVDDLMQFVGVTVAKREPLAPLLEEEFVVALDARAEVSLLDTAGWKLARDTTATAPRVLTWAIRRIFHDTEGTVDALDPDDSRRTPEGTLTPMYRMAGVDALYRPTFQGRLYWHERARRIVTVDDAGETGTLTGKLHIWANFIPTVETFVDVEQLQGLVVERLQVVAQMKRDDRFASRMLAEATAMG